jgi:hypothetical protein
MFRLETAWMRFVGLNSKINRVRRLIIAALLASAGTLAGEKQNYLAAIGPAPIRFHVARPEYDPAKVLPPLKMADAPATNAVESVTPPEPIGDKRMETPAVATEQAVAPGAAVSAPMESTSQPQAQTTTPESRPEPSQMTPQMLLRYFSKDGTREIFVPVPLEFTPPPPATGNGSRSSAVYISPAAK